MDLKEIGIGLIRLSMGVIGESKCGIKPPGFISHGDSYMGILSIYPCRTQSDPEDPEFINID